jgi:hypothetical protein
MNGKFEYRLYLLSRKSIEHFNDFVDRKTILEIFEDSGHGYPRATKYPGPADLSGYAFHGGTLRPITRHKQPPPNIVGQILRVPQAGKSRHDAVRYDSAMLKQWTPAREVHPS